MKRCVDKYKNALDAAERSSNAVWRRARDAYAIATSPYLGVISDTRIGLAHHRGKVTVERIREDLGIPHHKADYESAVSILIKAHKEKKIDLEKMTTGDISALGYKSSSDIAAMARRKVGVKYAYPEEFFHRAPMPLETTEFNNLFKKAGWT